MPRIDPLSLLRCLSVLLGPNGGIKSKDEVIRLANLMTKFSKKLVSKCIYIQILKSTNPDLLSQFMGAGGWNLVHMWLTDGILAKNWALIQELLELLLLCPVDIERLKSNNCPKLIKGLSKEGSHQGVRTLASRLVEQWLKMVKGEATPTVVAVQAATISSSIHSAISQNSVAQCLQPNGSIIPITSQSINSENAVTVQSSDTLLIQNSSVPQSIEVQQQTIKSISPQKSQLQIATHVLDKQQTVSTSISPSSVYKITIRDGKKVLTQVQTDAANINAISVSSLNTEVNGDIDNVLPTEDEQKTVVNSESIIERISVDPKNSADEVSKETISEVKENAINFKNIDETDSIKNKDRKDEKDISSDSSKSTSDKENRDKKDDKKSVNINTSSDKKSSSHTLSSNKSSSKHSSSSSKHSSSKHSSSSHRSSSRNSSSSSSSSRDKSSKDKEKEKHHSSSSSKSSSSKSKTERDKEKEKEKLKKDQAEKDKATLEKLQSQALCTKMGKIPKRKADEEKSEDSSSRKSSTDSKDSFKENKDKIDIKKVGAVSEKKNISISIENRKNSQDQTSRPKTVKTFNSKFRSTGLEEEVKPPPHRGAKKSVSATDKKILPPKLPSLKRPSPLRESSATPDKKAKFSLDSTNSSSDEKKGGIKLIPAKPKLMLLQESDMFMDALTASTKSKEPRKRKRRTSITKDGLSDSKKLDIGNNEHNRDTSSPPSSPTSPPSHSGSNKDTDDKSLLSLKPAFKFYQDTLETDEEKDDKGKSKTEANNKKENDIDTDDVKKVKREAKDDDDDDDDERSRTPTPENDFDDMKSSDSPEDPAAAVSEALKKEEHATLENRQFGVLKSVLLLQKRKGPKKSLKWKTDLESIRYFELDETERVNVTKTFTDMKQMEKQNEREAFQMARKLSSEDVMEEKTLWKALILIDMPPPLVESGKDSREKDIQYAREKGILQALYFNRSMIPDSPAEPDEERHHIFIEPKVIPLDDLTGNKDSEKDFTGIPWPEPKPPLPAPSTIIQNPYFQSFRPNQQQMMPSMGTQPPMAPIPQQMINSIPQMPPEMTNTLPPTSAGGGGWRTGDGKIVVPDTAMTPMSSIPTNYPQTMEGTPMVPPNMMGPPMYNQEGYIMGPDEMGYNNFQGPPGPGMYGPPVPGGPPPPGPPFQGPRGPPMHGNRGRGGPPGPGWFRGGPPRGMPWRGGWRGNGKQPPVCRQFSKNGYCRVGDKCQYLHPGVNCPPF